MNKKLITLAVASALSAPLFAHADNSSVTLFGRVGAEYGSTKIDQAAGANNYRQQVIGDNTGISRWGLLISEDLGNGLKANGRIEFAFRTGNGVTDSAREQWVGLSSKSWGDLQFGRIQSPFKDFAGGTSIDPFVATNLQARGSGGAMYAPANGLGAAAFVDHALRYNSPSFGGFSGSVLFSPSNATQAEGTTGAGNIGGKGGTSNYQVALKYKFGNAGEIFGGYSQDDASDAQRTAAAVNGRQADDEQVWRIGGAWNFGDFRIAGQYEDISNALAGNGGTTCSGGASANGGGDTGISTTQCNTALNTNGDGNIWFLTAQYKIGKTTLVAQGGRTQGDAQGTSVERKARNYTLGAIYQFSKRTRVFGGYQNVSIDGGANAANTPNNAQATVNAAIQPDRSTWTIGMRHDF
jgi:GBP family porin